MGELLQWASLLLTPICAVVGWFAGRRIRNNNTLNEMQKTIDLLVTKNKELVDEVIRVRMSVAKLEAENAELKQLIVKNSKPTKK